MRHWYALKLQVAILHKGLLYNIFSRLHVDICISLCDKNFGKIVSFLQFIFLSYMSKIMIFKWIFSKKHFCIFIHFLLKCVGWGPICNKSIMVQIMAWI